MSTPRRGLPYVYTTWITGLLAGENRCHFSPWVKAHFRIEKEPRDFDLSIWAAEHNAYVRARVEKLRADGWTVTVEDENAFRLVGKTAILSGKPDIIARRNDELLIVDVKTGQQKHADFWQVLVYLTALPMVRSDLPENVRGEVQYGDGARMPVFAADLTTEIQARIFAVLRSMGSAAVPAATPSARECQFCDVTATDCPAKLTVAVAEAHVEAF